MRTTVGWGGEGGWRWVGEGDKRIGYQRRGLGHTLSCGLVCEGFEVLLVFTNCDQGYMPSEYD